MLPVWNGFPPDRHKPFSIFLLCQHLKHLIIPILKGQQTQCCFSPAVSYNCPYIYHVEANWLLALLPLGVIGYIRSQSQEKKLRTLHPEINQKQNIINETHTSGSLCLVLVPQINEILNLSLSCKIGLPKIKQTLYLWLLQCWCLKLWIVVWELLFSHHEQTNYRLYTWKLCSFFPINSCNFCLASLFFLANFLCK